MHQLSFLLFSVSVMCLLALAMHLLPGIVYLFISNLWLMSVSRRTSFRIAYQCGLVVRARCELEQDHVI